MSNTISIEGADRIIRKLKQCADTEQYIKAVRKACALVERSAKEKAPKGNGELRRSIKSEITTDGNGIIGVVYTALEYAPYVEYGTGLFAEEIGRQDVPWHYQDEKGEWHTTKGMHPHPFLRPAFEENRQNINELIKGAAKPND